MLLLFNIRKFVENYADSFSFVDSNSGQLVVSIGLTSNLNLEASVVSTNATYTVVISDSFGFGDSVAQKSTFVDTLSSMISFSDGLAGVKTSWVTSSDAYSLNSTNLVVNWLTQQRQSFIELSDTTSGSTALQASRVSLTSFDDHSSSYVVSTRFVSDLFTTASSNVVSKIYLSSVVDQFLLGSLNTPSVVTIRVVSETLVLQSSTLGSTHFVERPVDSLLFNVFVAPSRVSFHIGSDLVVLSDARSFTYNAITSVADSINLIEGANIFVVYSEANADLFDLATLAVNRVDFNTSSSSSILLNDNSTEGFVFSTHLLSLCDFSDVFLGTAVYVVPILNSFGFSEVLHNAVEVRLTSVLPTLVDISSSRFVRPSAMNIGSTRVVRLSKRYQVKIVR